MFCVSCSLRSSLSALVSCTLIISVVFAVIPLCHHVALLSIAMALAGKAMGVIDTIGNLQLVKLYQRDSTIFLQVRGGRKRSGDGGGTDPVFISEICFHQQ